MKARVATWAINGRFLAQPQTGVQRYAGEITREIDGWLAADETLARRLSVELILPADCDAAPAYDAIKVRRSRHGSGHAWEQLVLPTMARAGLISFANTGPFVHGRQILCLHDANTFLEPRSYSRAFRSAYRVGLPVLARRARAVATVSRFSADMLQQFGVTGHSRARVIHNGHEHALRWNAARSRFSAPDALARPYVFALGSRARHKQIDLLLDLAPALDALGLDLVLSGGSSTIFSQTSATEAGNVREAKNVRHVGYVSDDDLAALFARATCFAFPSRTEGFGIPLLEAMVHRAPIVAAHCASMPEVCGDAALYAPADDPTQWLAQITRLAADPFLRAALVAKGGARYPRFSWRDGARAYLELALALSSRPAEAPRGSGAPLVGAR